MTLTRFDKDTQVKDLAGGLNDNSDIIEDHFDAINPHPQGRLVLDVSGDQDINLTAEQARSGQLIFTGVLTGNINVFVPCSCMVYHVQNQTTGNFTLTFKTGAGTGVVIQQASLPDHPRIKRVLCDGSNIVWADGSQIVEDNLHEETPDNGHYVRLASGLQKCWRKNISVVGTGGAHAQTSWPFPASFLPGSVPAIFANPTYRMASGSQSSTVMYTCHVPSVNANGVSILRFICPVNFSSDIELFADVMAIGRWK